jgi:hypothetical protein
VIIKKINLTFDVDWADESITQPIIESLLEKQIKSTWFITHDSSILETLRQNPRYFELGIHPNFYPNSTQGESEDEIVQNLLNLVPEAKVVRTHGVYQSGRHLAMLTKYNSLLIDSSIFLPEMQNIEPITHLTPHGSIKRLPVFWADDYEMLKDKTNWNVSKNIFGNGLKVFLFHPIHLHLNTPGYNFYEKSKRNGRTQNFEGRGTYSYFTELINLVVENKVKTNFLNEI